MGEATVPPPRPVPAVAFNPDGVPPRLRAPRRWVVWRYEKKKNGWTKVPVNPHTGGNADSTDPSTWGTIDDALKAYGTGEYAGIGFVLGGGFCGIDLDGCRDPGTGAITPGAQAIIERLSSYSETSPSGCGVKIFIRGEKPGWCASCRTRGSDFKQIEVYSDERYFTLTGARLGEREDVEERTAELGALCDKLWKEPTAPASAAEAAALNGVARAPITGGGLSDDDILRVAEKATNSAKFNALWKGVTTGYNSPSEADLALASILAFYAGPGGQEQVRRRMLCSGLARAKWTTNKTYLDRTISKAFRDRVEFYSPAPTITQEQLDRLGWMPGDALPAPAAPADGDSNGQSPSLPSASSNDADDHDGGSVPLGQRDPATGKLVLSPRRTLPTARAFLTQFHWHREGFTLRSYGGILWAWQANRYVEVEEGSLRHKLQPWLHEAARYVKPRSGKPFLAPFESNAATISGAIEAIRDRAHLDASVPMPCWLDGRERPKATEVLSCRSSNLHIPTGLVIPATPALFSPCALDFDYEPSAPPPALWLDFLGQLWGDDFQSVELLQEWFGYCLIPDTSQQKILLLVGPPRAGKGTIIRVLRRLVGELNVAAPTTTTLASNFGLQQLIGKTVAVLGDARFGGANIGVLVERLLTISGEDAIDIDRKYRAPVTVRLPVRFVLVSNELPKLTDAATALAKRFLILRLTNSFYGQEDTALTDKLVQELPGILNWAIKGLKRLRDRGRFVQPASSEEAVEDLEDLFSPVVAFVRECCTVGHGHRVEVDVVYKGFQEWCQREGRGNYVPAKSSFGRDLAAAVPSVQRIRSTANRTYYTGIVYPALIIPI